MNMIKKGFLVGFLLTLSSVALADATGAISDIVNSVTVTWAQFFTDVLSAVQGFGGLTWSMKIAVIVMCLIGLMKISSLSTFWAKLGPFQAWAAPTLGLIIGILTLGSSGTLSAAGIFAYIGSGSGAILLNELLNTVKAIPGLGANYVSIINILESILPAPLAKKNPALTLQKNKKKK